MNRTQELEVALSVARARLAYEGGDATYFVPPDDILVSFGITSIDGHPVEIDWDIPQPVTGL